MSNVYVEARPKGRPNDSPIEDCVVEDRANHVLATFKDQSEAIAWDRKEATSHSSPGSGTSAIRKSRTTGDLPRTGTHRRRTD